MCYYEVTKGGCAMSIAGDLIRGHTDAIILARLLQSLLVLVLKSSEVSSLFI